MFIIVLGIQPLCLMITKALCQEGHDVCVVSEYSDELRLLQQKVDCKTISGRPSHPHILRQADAQNADMLIAATANDEMNMVACQVAYSLFQIPKKIAFISSAHYLIRHELFGDANLPIDVFINTEQVIAEQLQQVLHFPQSSFFTPIKDSDFCIIGTTISSQGSFCHEPIAKLKELEVKCNILAIYHNHQAIILRPETILHAGDEVFIICQESAIEKLLHVLHGPKIHASNIVLSAKPGVVSCLADMPFSKDYRFKILEPNLATCHDLAPKHPELTILNGHLTDHDFLKEENIGQADVFCALSNDDEDNIMASLQAKDLGAQQVIPMIAERHYNRMMEHTPLDRILNPNYFILGRVLSDCYHTWIKSIYLIPQHNHLFVRIIVSLPHETKLWKQTFIHAVIRDDQLLPPETTPQLKPADQLILMLKSTSQINAIETLIKEIEQLTINTV